MKSRFLVLVVLALLFQAVPVGSQSNTAIFRVVPAGSQSKESALVANADLGPSVRIAVVTTTAKGKRTINLIEIDNKNGRRLFTVHMDGTVVAAKGITVDAAARDFWKALAGSYPGVCDLAKK